MSIQDLEEKVKCYPVVEADYRKLIDTLRGRIAELVEDEGSNNNIDALKQKLMQHREKYLAIFIPDEQFWLNWIEDKLLQLVGTEEKSSEEELNNHHQECLALCDRAVVECPSHALCMVYIQKALKMQEDELMDEDTLRSIFEKLITICGMDLFTGAQLWQKYREFELEEHEDSLDQIGSTDENDSAKRMKESKLRFIKLYHRQLSLPLVGNEEALNDFSVQLERYCVASDETLINPQLLQQKVQKCNEEREGRFTFELPLQSQQQQQLTAWSNYINYEVKRNELSRAQRLYERAFLALQNINAADEMLTLLLNYCEFVMNTLKNWELLERLTSKVVRLRRRSSYLWCFRLTALENTLLSTSTKAFSTILSILQRSDYDEENLSNGSVVYQEIQIALQEGFNSYEEYLQLYIWFIGHNHRQLKCILNHHTGPLPELHLAHTLGPTGLDELEQFSSVLQAAIKYLLQSIGSVESFLSAYCPEWQSGWWQLAKIQSVVECSSLSAAQTLLDHHLELITALKQMVSPVVGELDVVPASKLRKRGENAPDKVVGSKIWESVCNRFPNSYFLWQEFVSFLEKHGELDSIRRVYKKCCNMNMNVAQEDIGRDWLMFERLHGSSIDINLVTAKYYTVMKNTLRKSLETQPQIETHEDDSTAAAASNQLRNKRKRNDQDVGNSSIDVETSDKNKDRKKVKFAEETIQLIHNDKSQTNDSTELKVEPVRKVESNTGTPLVIHVSNFPFTSTIDHIRPFLDMKCHGLESAALVLSKAGKSRGIVEISCDKTENLSRTCEELQGSSFNERILKASLVSKDTTKHRDEVKEDSTKRSERSTVMGSTASPHLTTVFVNHLDDMVDSSYLRDHFSNCGKILAACVAVDKKTGKSKGNGLVQFEDEASRSKALKLSGTKMKGKAIEVKPSRFSLITVPATPKSESDSNLPTKRSEVSPSERENIQATKSTTLSFKPRGLMKKQRIKM